MSKLPAAEVAEVLRGALRKEIPVTLDDNATWVEAYCGDVAFKFGDWWIVFFNDCAELDYTAEATAPDGRTSDYEGWDGACPLSLLTHDEQCELERLLEGIEG